MPPVVPALVLLTGSANFVLLALSGLNSGSIAAWYGSFLSALIGIFLLAGVFWPARRLPALAVGIAGQGAWLVLAVSAGSGMATLVSALWSIAVLTSMTILAAVLLADARREARWNNSLENH